VVKRQRREQAPPSLYSGGKQGYRLNRKIHEVKAHWEDREFNIFPVLHDIIKNQYLLIIL
jgi:hypothetical protein